MKAKIYLMAGILLLCACKKSQNVVVTNDTQPKVATQSVNTSLIREITSLQNYDERKAAYVSMLTAYEKYTVWQTRFQTAIASQALNASQLKLINEMVAKATPSFFSSSTVRDSLSYFFADWQFRAEKVFSFAQLKYLGNDIVNFNKSDFIQLATGDIVVQQAKSKKVNSTDCSCSTNHGDFCGSTMMCGGSCGLGQGCGWWWSYSCNGHCAPLP